MTPQADTSSIADAIDSTYSRVFMFDRACFEDTASTGSELPPAKAAVRAGTNRLAAAADSGVYAANRVAPRTKTISVEPITGIASTDSIPADFHARSNVRCSAASPICAVFVRVTEKLATRDSIDCSPACSPELVGGIE